VEVIQADIGDRTALARLVQRSIAVINLVGILNETRNTTFAKVHVDVARDIVDACRAAGVQRVVHMSALNADVSAPSRYLQSKGEAEAIVAQSGLKWTIFRPSVIFGREDSLLNLFAKLQRFLPVIALAAPKARFQPVYVGDVARSFVHALREDATIGQRYALCGPRGYTLEELVRYVGELTADRRPIIPLGTTLSQLQASILERLPGKLMSRDNLASMQQDNVCADSFPAVFGITPTPLEAVAPSYIGQAAARSPMDEYRARSGR
jgi:NADH dehydrogenase